jgi:flagellar hook protein FlgE
VKTGEGQNGFYLTRAGNFTVDAQHNLVNADGMLVLDTGGAPLVIDPAITAFSISKDGQIIAVDSDGNTTQTGQFIGIVKVTNPGGLEKIGGNLYMNTPNSQDPGNLAVSQANDTTIGTGAIISGQLEMSNVDLTNEFAEMIIAQRGFQANARIITTSDEVLQEIVNLKH